MIAPIARKRNRSAVGWTMIAIAAWLVTEFLVALLIGLSYLFVALFLDLPLRIPIPLRIVSYFVALGAALVSVFVVRRYLISTSYRPLSRLP